MQAVCRGAQPAYTARPTCLDHFRQGSHAWIRTPKTACTHCPRATHPSSSRSRTPAPSSPTGAPGRGEALAIASVMPGLFDAKRPDLTLGTVDGRSGAPPMQAAAEAVMASQSAFTHVSNGRFKGGHITRHYGTPGTGVHALQL